MSFTPLTRAAMSRYATATIRLRQRACHMPLLYAYITCRLRRYALRRRAIDGYRDIGTAHE